MTRAIEVGVVYAKEAGRDTLTGMDMVYALEYQAQNFSNVVEQDDHLEEQLHTFEEKLIEDDDSEDDSEDEEEFTRAEDSSHPVVIEMNRCHDTWDGWIPQDDIQSILKRAVDHVKTTL